MKNIYKWSQSAKTTIYAPSVGRPPLTTLVDTSLNNVSVVPPDGKNLGNFKTPTPFEYSINVFRKFTGMKIEYWPKGVEYSRVVGCYGGEPLSGPTWERTALYNEALERLNDKVRDSADWGEDLAMPSRTAKLANLAEQARDFARKHIHVAGDPTFKIKDLWKKDIPAICNGYLQYRYGWKPLMQNVYDTALAQLNDTSGHAVRLRSSVKRPMRSTGFVTNAGSGTAYPNGVNQSVSGVQGCRFDISMRGMDSNSLSDYVTNNPAYLAWNLIPYSFVVDWFYNVGNWLRAQELALKYNPYFMSGSITELYACRTIETVSDKPDGDYFWVKYGKAYRRDVRFKRTVLTAWPLPHKPVLNTDLGSSPLLAAAALLGSLLGRKS